MSNTTDVEYAWAVFQNKLEDGDIKNLAEQDCTKTLFESGDLIALDLVHKRLKKEIPVFLSLEAKGIVLHEDVTQLKKIKLAFKDLHESIVATRVHDLVEGARQFPL